MPSIMHKASAVEKLTAFDVRRMCHTGRERGAFPLALFSVLQKGSKEK